ncbi:MAG: transketolase C-terminal domain-containing protein [Actinomycetota bacterium]
MPDATIPAESSTSVSRNRRWWGSRPGSRWKGSTRSRTRSPRSWPSGPSSSSSWTSVTKGLGGTFVGSGGSYDYASEGGTHHSPGDVATMLTIPGMQVLAPGHGEEAAALLRATYANGTPTYMRTSLATNEQPRDVAVGRLEVVRRGAGATVIAFGPMLTRTLAATEGLDVTVAYATSVEPFDDAGLAAIVGRDPNVIVVEPWFEGTSASTVIRALGHLRARYDFIGVPRAFIHEYGTWSELDADVGLDVVGLRARLERSREP